VSETTPLAPDGRIDAASAEAAGRSVLWLQIAAAVTFVIAVLTLSEALWDVGVAATRVEQAQRLAIVSIGSLQTASAVASFVAAFLLMRVAQMLRQAAARREAASIIAAVSYERAYWWLGAASLAMAVLPIAGSYLLGALDQSRIKTSIAAATKVGAALEEYARVRHEYPKARGIDELMRILDPDGKQRLPRRDGWNRPLEYFAFCERGFCGRYRLSSAGSDDAYVVPPHEIDDETIQQRTKDDHLPTADIIFGDGRFLVLPYVEVTPR
jgi:hypothetical protein